MIKVIVLKLPVAFAKRLVRRTKTLFPMDGMVASVAAAASGLIRVLAILSVLLAASGPSLASARSLDETLDAILKKELPPGFQVSVQVVDLETGRELMAKNPDLPLIPASTMKTATSAAALSVLKPDFTFVTEVLADGVKGGSVGNIYLRGQGDPYLVSERLFALTRDLKDRGLQEVRGDIICDDSYFVPGRPLDEQEKLGARSYHAPYGALSLNFNTMKLVVDPGPKPGTQARVRLDPVCEYAILEADVNTVRGRRAGLLSVHKDVTKSGREVIRVKGAIGVNANIKTQYVNVGAPALYTGAVFKEFLLREGIRVTGKIVEGKTPEKAVSLLKFESLPLSVIVYWLNKFSNNFIAEQLSLAMGASVHGAPGTREKGLSVIRSFLLGRSVEEGQFSLSEASGLSRRNRVSASALAKVLLSAARDFTYNAEFMSSLSVAGVDGTLRDKFDTQWARRRIRAKTGNLRGVNAIAGYGVSKGGRSLVFAVLVNSENSGVGFIKYSDRIIGAILGLPPELW